MRSKFALAIGMLMLSTVLLRYVWAQMSPPTRTFACWIVAAIVVFAIARSIWQGRSDQ